MTLSAGTRLGPYEIVAPIGAGGMGEVYRATDTRLHRTVAIKVLPSEFAADRERQQRFEREARLVASVSHPHICAVHDVGSQHLDGSTSISYLVMEFLEGETLAERLRRGSLPLDEALRVGAAIATALGAAHREHIVHRDLKPANVMLTRSGVKLLDFGIAKAVQAVGASTDALPTKTLTVATAAGVTVGTIPYMSPEQIEGRPVDWRSDIFSLGAVLYEMATGRRAFAGDGYGSIAANVLGGSPPPIAGAPALDRIVRGCLEKNLERRWQSAQDVARQLSELGGETAAEAPVMERRGMRWIPWAIAAAAVVTAALVSLGLPNRRAADEAGLLTTVKFELPPPAAPDGFLTHVEAPTMAVSPDGTNIAFVTINRSAQTRAWVRPLASLDARPVEGSEGAVSVFWSPDGASLAFFAGGKLKRVDLAGGAPVTICETRRDIGQAGTWGADGTILFASTEGEAIFKVADTGGTPVELLKPDPESGERRLVWPAFLSDGRRFTFLRQTRDDVGSIMLAGADLAPKEIARAKSNVQHVLPGYLLYADDSTLIARRLDGATGQLTGSPIPIADPVAYFSPTGLANFSASQTGVIAYQSHQTLLRITWFDRAGKELDVVRPDAGYQSLRLSPDERQLLFDRRHPRSGGHDLFLLEMERGTEIQLTTEAGSEVYPQWAPDQTIVYARTGGRGPRLHRRSVNSGADTAIGPDHAGLQLPTDTSRDGAWVLYAQRSARGDYDIHALRLADNKDVVLRASEFNEVDARFSPDGQFVAYVSNEGGRPNVYVMPFEGGGARRAVSTNGANTPRWSPDGRLLYYVANEGDEVYLTAVPVTPGASLQLGVASALFPLPPGRRWADFVPTRDGRLLALQHVQFAGTRPLTIIANWTAAPR